MFKKILLTLFVPLFVYTYTAKAAKIDTVITYSAAMNKNIKAVVITPDTYSKGTTYIRIYLVLPAA